MIDEAIALSPTAELAGWQPPELASYENNPKKASPPRNLLRQTSQDIVVPKSASTSNQDVEEAHNARPSVESVSPRSSLCDDGRASAGTTSTDQVSPPSTTMSRISTQRSVISRGADDDRQVFEDDAIPPKSSLPLIARDWTSSSLPGQQLTDSSKKYFIENELPKSRTAIIAGPSTIAAINGSGCQCSSIPDQDTGLASTTLPSAALDASGSDVPGAHKSFHAPPTFQPRSDEGESISTKSSVPSIANNQEFRHNMSTFHSPWNEPSTASMPETGFGDSFDVMMEDLMNSDSLLEPGPPSYTSPPVNSSVLSQVPVTTDTNHLPHPTGMVTKACPDVAECGYTTKPYDPDDPLAVRHALALLRRHVARKLERQTGSHPCGDCGQVFTRHDNLVSHKRQSRCPGSVAGTSRSGSGRLHREDTADSTANNESGRNI